MKHILRTHALFFLIVHFILLTQIFSQTKESSITGTVVDEQQTPLVGVSVVVVGTRYGTSSNSDGVFTLRSLPPGEYTITFSLIGYESVRRTNILAKADSKISLKVTLRSKALELEGIDIIRNRFRQKQEDPRTSIQTMDPREAKILPGAAEDVMRSLQALPGVLAPNDFSSQLIVRGSGPDQNLIVMDEVEVFNPYRLYGAISMFNPETISDISLITGGFPAKYGDRLSAVLDVTNREGKKVKPVYGNMNTSLTNANMVFEGHAPFGMNGSWLVSTRRTYYDLIIGPIAKSSGLVSGDVAFPNFSDLQAKFVLQPFMNHKFYLNGVTSADGVNVISGDKRESLDSVAVLNSTINNVLSAGWYFAPTNESLNKLNISWYDNHGSTEFDGKFLDPVLNRDDYTNAQNDSLKALARLFGLSINSAFEVNKYAIREEYSLQSGNHLFEVGGGFDYITAKLRFELNLSPELRKIIESNPRGSALITNTLQEQKYSKTHVFIQDRLRITDAFSLQPGLRFDYYSNISRAYVSPRINASYALDPITTLRAAWGLYYQPPGYEKLLDQNQFFDFSDENLQNVRAEKSVHYILGIERWLTTEWLARSELYYKSFDDLIVQERVQGNAWVSEPIPGADIRNVSGWTAPHQITYDSLTATPLNDSYGEAYGVEVIIEKRNIERESPFSGWISYALAWAQRYRNGYIIPFTYDQRHTLNIVGNYKPLDWLEVGIFWRFGSNFPITEPVGVRPRIIAENGAAKIATDFAGNAILDIDWGDESRINQARKPLYHRLDLRATAYTKFWGMQWAFYLDVINVYNQSNVNNYRYFVESDGSLGRKAVNMFPILPTIGINARF